MALNVLSEIDVTATGDDYYEAVVKCKDNWALMDASGPFSTTTTLTAAQVKTLATPIEVVAAGGAGTLLEFVSATLAVNWSGAASSKWGESDDDLVFEYETTAVDVSETVDSTGFIDTTAVDELRLVRATDIQDTDLIASVNKGILLHNDSGNFTDATGTPTSTLIVKVVYRVHATGL